MREVVRILQIVIAAVFIACIWKFELVEKYYRISDRAVAYFIAHLSVAGRGLRRHGDKGDGEFPRKRFASLSPFASKVIWTVAAAVLAVISATALLWRWEYSPLELVIPISMALWILFLFCLGRQS
ncbi:MAG: hypothetical protein HPY75_06085 [Actinobacteria bacterium]|nr:hypothetical protein [Actinomycetota bacterium]